MGAHWTGGGAVPIRRGAINQEMSPEARNSELICPEKQGPVEVRDLLPLFLGLGSIHIFLINTTTFSRVMIGITATLEAACVKFLMHNNL